MFTEFQLRKATSNFKRNTIILQVLILFKIRNQLIPNATKPLEPLTFVQSSVLLLLRSKRKLLLQN